MTLDTLTATQAADECGVSRQTIHAWFDEGLPKRPTRPQVMHFLANRETQTTGFQRERINKAQAERLEMANAKVSGNLLDAAEVEQENLKAIAFLTQRLSALPQRCSTDEVIQTKIHDELVIARNAFADDLVTLAAQPVVGKRRGSPRQAKKKSRRVGGRGKNPAARVAGTGPVAQ